MGLPTVCFRILFPAALVLAQAGLVHAQRVKAAPAGRVETSFDIPGSAVAVSGLDILRSLGSQSEAYGRIIAMGLPAGVEITEANVVEAVRLRARAIVAEVRQGRLTSAELSSAVSELSPFSALPSVAQEIAGLRGMAGARTMEDAQRLAQRLMGGLASSEDSVNAAAASGSQAGLPLAALTLSLDTLKGQADARVSDLAANRYAGTDTSKIVQELQALPARSADPSVVRQYIARSLLTEMGKSLDPKTVVLALESLVQQKKGDGELDSTIIETVMDHIYAAKDLAESSRIVEFVEKQAELSRNPRVQGLAYALVQRERDHAKNRQYKDTLDGVLERIIAQAGGRARLVIPYVPASPGAVALKFKSGVTIGERLLPLARGTQAGVEAAVDGGAAIVGKVSGGISDWLRTLAKGAEQNLATTFFGGALIVSGIGALYQGAMSVLGIAAFVLMALDMHRKAFEDPYKLDHNNDYPNLAGAFFQTLLLAGFFIGGASSIAGSPVSLMGLVAGGFAMRTVANWSFAKRIATAGFCYNVLIFLLTYGLLGIIPPPLP